MCGVKSRKGRLTEGLGGLFVSETGIGENKNYELV